MSGDQLGSPADGAALITAERTEQVTRKGWTPEHDDKHDNFELLCAADAYVHAAELGPGATAHLDDPPWYWPREIAAWKPSDDPIRNLVKAGALIAAEIDRLQRKEARS